MSSLYEAYINFPSYDARAGSGYGATFSTAKTTPSIGRPMSMTPHYPYIEPPTKIDDEDDVDVLPAKLKKKVIHKIGGVTRINDPYGWVDRGSFVNWASRLDLYEARERIDLEDVVKGLEGSTSTGGISQLIAMGNGAGIYKTKHGKTIGMNIGGHPQSYVATKTTEKIAPSLTDFIKDYMSDDDEEA